MPELTGARKPRPQGSRPWRLVPGSLLPIAIVLALPAVAAPPAKKTSTKAAAPAVAEEPAQQETRGAGTTPDGRPRDPEFGDPPTATEGDPEHRPSPLTPAPEEMPQRPHLEAPDYAGLLGELVALRARVGALTSALYDSKLRISLEADGEEARIAGLIVTVDGAIVYTAPERFVGGEELVVYEHAVAPGRHVVGIEIERLDARAKGPRSWHSMRYAVEVPEKRTLAARVELEDDSSLKDSSRGRYRARASLRMEVLEP